MHHTWRSLQLPRHLVLRNTTILLMMAKVCLPRHQSVKTFPWATVLAVADCLPQVVKPEEKPIIQEEFMGYCTFRLLDSVKTQNAADIP